MRTILILLAVALVGCDSAPRNVRPDDGALPYTVRLVNGNRVVEFKLTDGTPCVSVADKAVSCGWERAR